MRPTIGASRLPTLRLKSDEERVARERAENEKRRRVVTIWTVGGHVFEGHLAEEDAEGPLRDGLRAAPEPGATIDLHAGGTVTAIVAAQVVAVRFRASRD